MNGFFVYVNRADFDSYIFLGHVMHQISPGVTTERMIFQSKSYQEARDVAQLVCDYLNGVL